jgi:hypothetical protein
LYACFAKSPFEHFFPFLATLDGSLFRCEAVDFQVVFRLELGDPFLIELDVKTLLKN